MASSSDVLVQNVAGEFSEIALCSICTEVFTDPRQLACRHTFCLQCLQKYAEEKRCGELIACPMCRQETVIPDGGLVDLARNRDMERLIETSRRVESRLKEGVYHCDRHAGKPVVLYCQTCSCLLCSTCIVVDHLSHQYQEIDVAAGELLKQLEVKLGHTVKQSVSKLQENVRQINRMNRVWQRADESRAKVMNHYHDIEALLLADRRSVLSELDMATNELRQLKDQMNNFITKLQSFDVKEGKIQPLDVISRCRELMQSPVEDMLNMQIDERSVSFVPNVKLFKLESKAVNLLGTVSRVEVKRPGQIARACHSENVPRSIFGASAVTDEDFDSGKVQPVCPEWCACDYCEPMTDVGERRCCATIRQVLHICESAGVACVTQLPEFRVNCLNLSVMQLAFYEQHDRPQQQLPKPIHEIYRELAYLRFRRWIYRVPRGHVTNGVPACALDSIRQTFAAEDSCSFVYPR